MWDEIKSKHCKTVLKKIVIIYSWLIITGKLVHFNHDEKKAELLSLFRKKISVKPTNRRNVF